MHQLFARSNPLMPFTLTIATACQQTRNGKEKLLILKLGKKRQEIFVLSEPSRFLGGSKAKQSKD